ncbi:MAG: hypothetical protein NVS1B14_05850 [Vulcanimicrobiaceae bacterium]
MNDRSIREIAALFVLLFALLGLRQLYVQIIAGPSLAAKPYNPRHALLQRYRGRILASDGSILAQTLGKSRVYPYGAQLAQTVGYISSRYGTSGIEDAYDQALTPPDETGDLSAQAGAIGQSLSGRGGESRGADVVTTINPVIEDALSSQLSVHARGAGVVLDPRSGAILAIASVPGFDPNAVDRTFAELVHAPQSPLLNRATNGLYPPGSTFKIFTAAAALDSGTVALTSQFEDPGYLVIGNYTVHDDEGEATGYLDLTGAFARSSNVDFAQIALKLGTRRFYDYGRRWGLGAPLDFQLPAERDRLPAAHDV